MRTLLARLKKKRGADMAPHPPHGPQRGEPPAILPRIISPTATGRASTTHGVLIGYMVAATGSGVASGLAWSRPRTDEELCQGRVYDLDRAAWRGVGRGLGPEFGTSKRGEGESGIGGLGERGSSRPFPQQHGFLWGCGDLSFVKERSPPRPWHRQPAHARFALALRHTPT